GLFLHGDVEPANLDVSFSVEHPKKPDRLAGPPVVPRLDAKTGSVTAAQFRLTQAQTVLYQALPERKHRVARFEVRAEEQVVEELVRVLFVDPAEQIVKPRRESRGDDAGVLVQRLDPRDAL